MASRLDSRSELQVIHYHNNLLIMDFLDFYHFSFLHQVQKLAVNDSYLIKNIPILSVTISHHDKTLIQYHNFQI